MRYRSRNIESMNIKQKRLLVFILGFAAAYLWSNKGQEMVNQVYENLRRGERLNNPGNIRKSSTAWQGLAAEQLDSAFATFTSAFYGLRAMAKLLLTYYKSYGLNTISKIVSRYAPSSENNTAQYIANVALWSGIGPNVTLNLNDGNTLLKIMQAMIKMEQGRNIYGVEQIKSAISSAIGG